MAKFEDWPEDQRKALGKVAAGLVEGDLMPLAAYFRAGYYEIEPALARELADMIGGGEDYMPYRLEAIGRSKRPGGWGKRSEESLRQMTIGVWVEREVRGAPRGAYAGILLEACTRFNVGKTAVTNAHREVRRRLTYPASVSQDELLAIWADIYSADIAMSPD
uniref:hypothetical protein n=1 Tax=Altererythrobacter segetis TaxID=1104773 RepID=UPI00140AA014|nr:hypothetical protein [Altererythrobacter segetis]